MSYPVFDVDENGNIVSPDLLPEVPASVAPLDVPVDGVESDLFDQLTGSSDTVSSGDVYPLPDYSDSFTSLEESLAYLASEQASASGYLSTSCLDAFDRVVEGYSNPYYCAFRNSSDSYNGVLYIADHVTVNGNKILMEDAYKVELYRQQSGGSYNYQYFYSRSSVGDVEIDVSGNLMYYTNCVEGYPLLAGIQSPDLKLYDSFFNMVFFMFFFIITFLGIGMVMKKSHK